MYTKIEDIKRKIVGLEVDLAMATYLKDVDEETRNQKLRELFSNLDKELDKMLNQVQIRVPVANGTVVATRNPDPDYDGISVDFECNDGYIAPLITVEATAENKYAEIDAYCYEDANSEEWTHKFSLNTKDLVESFGE